MYEIGIRSLNKTPHTYAFEIVYWDGKIHTYFTYHFSVLTDNKFNLLHFINVDMESYPKEAKKRILDYIHKNRIRIITGAKL